MVIGMLGGGQLARMMAQAGQALDAQILFLDPAADACAGEYAEQLVGDYDDTQQLAILAERADVVTYEFENVPAASVEFLNNRTTVYPATEALATAQDRLQEKQLFEQLGIAVPDFAPVNSLSELTEAITTIGLPCVLKTRRMGYDGKGQFVIEDTSQAAQAWQAINQHPATLEAMVPFGREVSIIAVRSINGECAFYPIAENTHQQGILRYSISKPGDEATTQAQQYIQRLLDHFNYVGVMALELFEVNGQLLANEFAPRVHNSGHWTIEGAVTSQFENHLRAVTGMPLASTEAVGFSGMINCIGEMCPAPTQDHNHIYAHDYGKQSREGRKVGHLTVNSDSEAQLHHLMATYQGVA